MSGKVVVPEVGTVKQKIEGEKELTKSKELDRVSKLRKLPDKIPDKTNQLPS
ncbi:MAG: hypothetical protein H8E42_11645 [Nitrospinae bacterium]|nr:hypothetical protein [Nitrospinota bacterium]